MVPLIRSVWGGLCGEVCVGDLWGEVCVGSQRKAEPDRVREVALRA